jgi:hypothetical protein
MKSSIDSRWLVALVLVVLVGAGCGEHEKAKLSQKIGANCTVQFRRGDALGSGASLPVSPTVFGINGAEVSVAGKLKAVDKEWIVLEKPEPDATVNGKPQPQPPAELWIPREAVLLVAF